MLLPKPGYWYQRSIFTWQACMCTCSPSTRGKHARPSKFCEHHYKELDNTSNLPTPHCTYDLLEKGRVGTLTENDDNVLVGRHKAKGVNHFYDRTAGVMAIVRPCGILVNITIMYTCESPIQVYLFLVMTFAWAHDIDRLRYLGYDRACDLHPFLCILEAKGAYFARWLNMLGF